MREGNRVGGREEEKEEGGRWNRKGKNKNVGGREGGWQGGRKKDEEFEEVKFPPDHGNIQLGYNLYTCLSALHGNTLAVLPAVLFTLQAKCHQYWPEAGSVSFGDLTVTIIEVQELAYYTIRTFRMNRVSQEPCACRTACSHVTLYETM